MPKILTLTAFIAITMVGIMGLAYADEAKTLKEWGVPSIKGKDPFNKVLEDLDKYPGKETLAEFYNINNDVVGVFSVNVNGKKLTYCVAYDKDWKEPTDLSLFDYNGDGLFEKIHPDKDFKVPKWIKNYKKSVVSG